MDICLKQSEHEKENVDFVATGNNAFTFNETRRCSSRLRLLNYKLKHKDCEDSLYVPEKDFDFGENTNSEACASDKSENSLNHFVSTGVNTKIKNTSEQSKAKKKCLKIKNPNNSKLKNISLHTNDSDSVGSEDWEDVNDSIENNKEYSQKVIVNELDFMQKLLVNCENDDKSFTTNQNAMDTSLTIKLPAKSNKSVLCKTEEQLKRLALSRELSKKYRIMHTIHVLCFLAYGRFLNRRCDNLVNQSVGLSLLHKTNSIWNDSNREILKISQWTEDHLSNCLLSILSREGSEFQFDSCLSTPRVMDKTDCIILFISALRCLGFDVKLVIGLNPIPLTPPKITKTCVKQNTIKRDLSKRSSSNNARDIINPNVGNDRELRFFVFAEVFLPFQNEWICVDSFTSPNGSIGYLPYAYHKTMLYTIGYCTTQSTLNSELMFSYIDRSPIDLSARYDLDWSIQSVPARLSNERWAHFLKLQKTYMNKDALNHGSLCSTEEAPILVERDRLDQDGIRQKLLNKPLPDKMHHFKNHPLYVLRRHLLKYQVIHPPDAVPLGFFHNEPIYSRDCVQLCHNRETWFRKAMVIRPHEKPAKIVKSNPNRRTKMIRSVTNEPNTVGIFGSWQVEPYEPPTARNGQVPRNAHGNVDLFKPCMIPYGCVHICLPGIQHIARKLHIDCVGAVVGWTFHGSGWAHPKVFGYVVCQEFASKLVRQWYKERMDAERATKAEKSHRALLNWQRFVRGVFLWHRIKTQFSLAPMANKKMKKLSKKSEALSKKKRHVEYVECPHEVCLPTQLGSIRQQTSVETKRGWMSLGNLTDWSQTNKETMSPLINLPKLSVKRDTQSVSNRYSLRRKKCKKEVVSDSVSCDDRGEDSGEEFVVGY